MNTTQSKSSKIPADLTLQGTLLDAMISIALIAGAWATDWIGKYFYPAGVPFPYSTILFARDIATLLWVIGTSFRYFRYAYRELSLTLNSIASSKLWNHGRKSWSSLTTNTKRTWGCLDVLSQKIVLMVCIVFFAVALFGYSGGEFYFVFPIAYWGSVFAISQVLDWKNKKPRQSFWLAAFLLFLLILTSTFIVNINDLIILQKLGIITRVHSIQLIDELVIGINSLGNYVIGEMTLVQKTLIALFGFAIWITNMLINRNKPEMKNNRVNVISKFTGNKFSYSF